ncbi:hypothetical protein AwPolaro_01490 [Polaromonas sp.]|nr:hypothetical protein AwPolaro_01490 [Polaromonas sp.]
MYILLIGIVGVVLKYLEIGPVAELSWLWVLSPFALTVVWWWVADKSGYSKRKEIKRMEERKQKRINKNRVAMGQPKKRF